MAWNKKLSLLLIGFSSFSLLYAQEEVNSNPTSPISSDTSFIYKQLQEPNILTDSLISVARRYLKKPYNYRPNNQVRFDCSGFSSYIYSQFGYTLKRSSAEQAKQFNKVDRDQLKTGDLVFFSGRRINNYVGHVGIVVNTYENGQFDFIHASNQSGIVISHSDEGYYARRYIKAGRVIEENLSIPELTEITNYTTDESVTNYNEISPENNKTPEPVSTYHYVNKGDTLYSIAKKYGITVIKLKKLNQLNSDTIHPKQKLIIT